MGILNISVLFPEGFPSSYSEFLVSYLDSNRFELQGSETIVEVLENATFHLNTPLVVDGGNGTYTASSY